MDRKIDPPYRRPTGPVSRTLSLALLVAACGSGDPQNGNSSFTSETGPLSSTGANSSDSSGIATDADTDVIPATGTENTSSDSETSGSTSETTTSGPTECRGPRDCADPALQVCADGVCVACADDDGAACSGMTPVCDDASNACVACNFHEQCQAVGSPACNIVTGACFDSQAVTTVSLSTPGSLQAAASNVADGAEHALVITGSSTIQHTVSIDGGKTIAIVSPDTTTQNIRGAEDGPVITVGEGSAVFLHRLRIEDSVNVGISVGSAASLFADSVQVLFNAGGGITLAAQTRGQLRNSVVGMNGDLFAGTSGIDSSGDLSVLYSSIVGNFGDMTGSLLCSGGTVEARNTIVVGQEPNSINCPGLTATNSAFDQTIEGEGNANVGSFVPTWFISGADYHLTEAGKTQFADIAVWNDGDPPFDFEGDLRPSIDGSQDYPGVDTVP